MYQGNMHGRAYSGVHAQPRTYMLSYKPGRTVVAYAQVLIPVHSPPPGNKVYLVNVTTYYSMYMYAMRQNSVLKGMGARFKIYILFFPVCYLGLSALLPVFGTKLCAIAHRRQVQ